MCKADLSVILPNYPCKGLEKSLGENCECFKATSISKLSGKQYNLKHSIAIFPKQYYFGMGFFSCWTDVFTWDLFARWRLICSKSCQIKASDIFFPFGRFFPPFFLCSQCKLMWKLLWASLDRGLLRGEKTFRSKLCFQCPHIHHHFSGWSSMSVPVLDCCFQNNNKPLGGQEFLGWLGGLGHLCWEEAGWKSGGRGQRVLNPTKHY